LIILAVVFFITLVVQLLNRTIDVCAVLRNFEGITAGDMKDHSGVTNSGLIG
jgi:hypothetical protein